MNLRYILIILHGILITPAVALAVPPPDFIFSAGSQIFHLCGMLAFLCSAGTTVALGRFKHYLNSPYIKLIAISLVWLGLFLTFN